MESQQDPLIVSDVEEDGQTETSPIDSDEVTDRLQILSDLKSTIVDEGVSRDDVEAMNNVLHGYAEPSIAVESYLFTQQRSPMNIQLALEAVEGGIVATVKRWIAKLIEFVKNIGNRCKNMFNKAVLGAKLKHLDEVNGNLTDLNGVIDKLCHLDPETLNQSKIAEIKKKAIEVVGSTGKGHSELIVIVSNPSEEKSIVDSIHRWTSMVKDLLGTISKALVGDGTIPEDTRAGKRQELIDELKSKQTSMEGTIGQLVPLEKLRVSKFNGFVKPNQLQTLFDDFSHVVVNLTDEMKTVDHFAKRSSDDSDIVKVKRTLGQYNTMLSQLNEMRAFNAAYLKAVFNLRKLVLRYSCEILRGCHDALKETGTKGLNGLSSDIKEVLTKIKHGTISLEYYETPSFEASDGFFDRVKKIIARIIKFLSEKVKIIKGWFTTNSSVISAKEHGYATACAKLNALNRVLSSGNLDFYKELHDQAFLEKCINVSAINRMQVKILEENSDDKILRAISNWEHWVKTCDNAIKQMLKGKFVIPATEGLNLELMDEYDTNESVPLSQVTWAGTTARVGASRTEPLLTAIQKYDKSLSTLQATFEKQVGVEFRTNQDGSMNDETMESVYTLRDMVGSFVKVSEFLHRYVSERLKAHKLATALASRYIYLKTQGEDAPKYKNHKDAITKALSEARDALKK